MASVTFIVVAGGVVFVIYVVVEGVAVGAVINPSILPLKSCQNWLSNIQNIVVVVFIGVVIVILDPGILFVKLGKN